MRLQFHRAVLTLLMTTGCGRVGFQELSGDAQMADAAITPGTDVSLPTQPFITPVVALTVLNYPGEDDDPTLPDDQLEIYFTSDRSGAGDIYRSVRASTSSAWTAPAIVTELSTSSPEGTPEISADGLTMYFARFVGTTDIHVSTRATRSSPWTAPTVVSELSTADDEDSAVLGPDGLTIMVSRYTATSAEGLWIATRPTPTSTWGSLVRVVDLEEPGLVPTQAWLGESAIYFTIEALPVTQELRAALRTGMTSFGPPVAIPELDFAGQQSDPWLSSDLGTIYFESEDDLYMTTRAP